MELNVNQHLPYRIPKHFKKLEDLVKKELNDSPALAT